MKHKAITFEYSARQLFFIISGILLIESLIFFLGVLVGWKLGPGS